MMHSAGEMMRLLSILLLLSMSCFATANDSVIVGQGGSVRAMDGEHSSVQMVREWVRMEVGPTRFQVSATFIFHNDGPATTVRMGFPESGGGDIGADHFKTQTGFKSFATWVDGRRVRAKRIGASAGGGGYQAYWVKRVRFARGQTRRVRVVYHSQFGGTSMPHESFTYYNFTGGNWHGEVEESHFLASFSGMEDHLVAFSMKSNMLAMRQRGNRFAYTWRNWQAEGNLDCRFVSTLPNWLTHDPQQAPLGAGFDRVYAIDAKKRTPKYFDRVHVDWMPPAFVHRGTTFMHLRTLADWLRLQDKTAGRNNAEESVAVVWNHQTKNAWLQVGTRQFVFRPNQPRMWLSGHGDVPMNEAPMLVQQVVDASGQSRPYLFVPVAPIMQAMNGKVTVNARAHRLWLRLF